MIFKNRSGLTLIEWLVVIVIIGILLIIVFASINPLRERDRASDSRRKADLNRISIALEEFYSDSNYYCYPTEAVFEQADSLQPYLNQIPRDPDTAQSYFYSSQDSDCPQYYRVYTNLRWENDPAVVEVGCLAGCGPNGIYNYGVSSPNTGLVIELDTGCYNDSSCTICSSDEDGNCDCNAVGTCCVLDMADCPDSPSCDQCFLAEKCFFDVTCGGNQDEPMPY